jgi:hypothetical protein
LLLTGVSRHRRVGGAGLGGLWFGQESIFELSDVLRRGPPPPLVPVTLSVFLLEDDAGEPGVCEITVAISPDESALPSAANFYDECQAASALRQV